MCLVVALTILVVLNIVMFFMQIIIMNQTRQRTNVENEVLVAFLRALMK